ncbi:MAG: hypothetical protein OJF49_000929 [Ktedonobacterales bacterium]|nr:MAG: hypothetical protein OJF49_000929 [Ktedonobacterales bacterium]
MFAVVFALAFGGGIALLSAPTTLARNCAPNACQRTFYGANYTSMTTATSNFTQTKDNYCGVASTLAVKKYDWIQKGGTTKYSDQDSVAALLNSSSAVSPWGRANPNGSNHGAFVADIATDGGTDPRSVSWAEYTTTPIAYYFHNWIYRTSSSTATYEVGADFGPASGINDPFAVVIAHGLHLEVLDGVFANLDPSAGGGTIYGISIWDPGVGSPWGGYSPEQEYVWDTYDWTSNSSVNQWAQPYASNNGYDPDPSTYNNPHYDPPFSSFGNQQHHWIGYYATDEQDRTSSICNGLPDYALDENGNLAPYNGSSCG